MNKVTKLPTAASSYYTVRKAGNGWDVALVTPAPGRALVTKLYRYNDREAAVAHARAVAARMLRPFKDRRAA